MCFPCSRKEALAAFHAEEALEVRRKCDAFTDKVAAYQALFQEVAPRTLATNTPRLESVSTTIVLALRREPN